MPDGRSAREGLPPDRIDADPFAELHRLIELRCGSWSEAQRGNLVELARRAVALHERRMRGERVRPDVEVIGLALKGLGESGCTGVEVFVEWMRLVTEQLAGIFRGTQC